MNPSTRILNPTSARRSCQCCRCTPVPKPTAPNVEDIIKSLESQGYTVTRNTTTTPEPQLLIRHNL